MDLPPRLREALAGERAWFAFEGESSLRRDALVLSLVLGAGFLGLGTLVAGVFGAAWLAGAPIEATVNGRPIGEVSGLAALVPMLAGAAFAAGGVAMLVRGARLARVRTLWLAASSRGLHVAWPRRVQTIPWTDVADARLEGDAVSVRLRPRPRSRRRTHVFDLRGAPDPSAVLAACRRGMDEAGKGTAK